MTTDLQDLLTLAESLPNAMLYVCAVAGGFVEYLLPMLPGDTLIVALGIVSAQHKASALLLWATCVLASTVGGLVSFEAGLLLLRTARGRRFLDRHDKSVQIITRRIDRFGSAYLVVNRFVPGLRAFFFVAAAVIGIRRRVAFAWGLVSSVLWMTLLFGLAYLVGDNLDQLKSHLSVLGWAMLALAAGIVVYIARAFTAKNRSAALDPELPVSTSEIGSEQPASTIDESLH